MHKGMMAVVVVLALVTASAAWAATEQVLYSFTNGSDGGFPLAGLIFDATGNLYGTTSSGGVYDQGTVFELSPSNGTWTETVLYSFTGGIDGGLPAAGLFIDKVGNLYGTTQQGGSGGTVFELKRRGAGWQELVLHSFGSSGDGTDPSGIALDKANRAFGTTQRGGVNARGTVFGAQLVRGGWQEAVLYSFNSGTDGSYPQSDVVVDSTDHIYGTTPSGGNGRGTVFELSDSQSGWKEKIIYDFEGGYDGTTPSAGLVMDSAGNLYGTTSSGGANNQGTVFELSYSAQGWTKTIIDNLSSSPSNAALTLDQSGNLYGEEGNIAIFELSPSSGGWTETTFFQFDNADGEAPNGGLIFDQAGNMYGTTQTGGGVFNAGIVFEIMP